jgi:four helix bundle protein
MDEIELKKRTKAFGLRTLRLVEALPNSRTGRIVADQLGRSATSVGANYRASCRARSGAEFLSKLGNVEEEADESCFWLEIIIDASLMSAQKVTALLNEANQLVAIISASRRTVKGR